MNRDPEIPRLGVWVGPSMLLAAKDLLRAGQSLDQAATYLGVSSHALDVALWNDLGNPKLTVVR